MYVGMKRVKRLAVLEDVDDVPDIETSEEDDLEWEAQRAANPPGPVKSKWTPAELAAMEKLYGKRNNR